MDCCGIQSNCDVSKDNMLNNLSRCLRLQQNMEKRAVSVKECVPVVCRANAQADFEISAEDMEVLKNLKKIESYGAASGFPICGGKM